MADVTYYGIYEGPDLPCVFASRGQRGRPLIHCSRHATGLAWGFAGPGSADLARSILADYLGVAPLGYVDGRFSDTIPEVDGIYQRFTLDVIAHLPSHRRSWRLDGATIEAWLRAHPFTRTCPVHRCILEPDDQLLAPHGGCHGCYIVTHYCRVCQGDGQLNGQTCRSCAGSGESRDSCVPCAAAESLWAGALP